MGQATQAISRNLNEGFSEFYLKVQGNKKQMKKIERMKKMFNAMLKMRNNKKKGFTLIELIVVIAILAILAMLAIPLYNGLREKSAQNIADANARSVYTAGRAVEALNDSTVTISSLLGADFKGTSEYDAGIATWSGTVDGKSVTGTYPKS